MIIEKLSRKSGVSVSMTAEELYLIMKGSNTEATDEDIEKMWEDSWSQIEDPEQFVKLIGSIEEGIEDAYDQRLKIEVKNDALED